jgi:cytochrome c-type biogenesis protein CcsB
MRYEFYSNVAVVSSVVVYLLAMIAHAAEWAAARNLRTRQKQLVAVGADARPEPAEGSTETSVRVELFGRIGVAFTMIGFLLSVGGLVLRGLAAGRMPWGNMFEFTVTAMVLVVAAYLVLVWRFGMRWLGLPVTLLAAIGNGLAVTVFYVAVAPLVPALHSVWFIIHIVAAAIAGAAFNICGVLSILFLLKQRAERRGRTGGYLDRLPDLRRLDLLAYRFGAFSFPLWTFTVAAGAIWAEYAWGRYWGWDPKETWALVTWVIYACYLHARATAGWKGTRAAVIAIIGVASFWFNFIGINLLVSGLHSYAGI